MHPAIMIAGDHSGLRLLSHSTISTRRKFALGKIQIYMVYFLNCTESGLLLVQVDFGVFWKNTLTHESEYTLDFKSFKVLYISMHRNVIRFTSIVTDSF